MRYAFPPYPFASPSLSRVSQQAPIITLCSPHSKPPGSAGILPAAAGTGWREGKAVSPERRLGAACRLEGGAPGHGLLRRPPKGEGLGRG